MKPELSALMRPVSPANQAEQSLLARQSGQDLPALKNDVDCVNDTNGTLNTFNTFKDSYCGGTISLRDAAASSGHIYRAPLPIKARKKRFG